jgi:hypothetical protein
MSLTKPLAPNQDQGKEQYTPFASLNHTTLWATEQLTIAPNAIRLDNTSQLRFTLVAKAPDWKVTSLSPSMTKPISLKI